MRPSPAVIFRRHRCGRGPESYRDERPESLAATVSGTDLLTFHTGSLTASFTIAISVTCVGGLLAMNDELTLGLQEHQRGRLDEAARRYRMVLAGHPDHAEALHLLGVV